MFYSNLQQKKCYDPLFSAPGEAACPAPHVSTCQSGAGLRSVSVDRDSGHYSLHTVATGTSAKQQEF